MARVIVGTRHIPPVWAGLVAQESREFEEAKVSGVGHMPVEYGVEVCPTPLDSYGEEDVRWASADQVCRFRLPEMTKSMYGARTREAGILQFLRLYRQFRREGLLDHSPAFGLAKVAGESEHDPLDHIKGVATMREDMRKILNCAGSLAPSGDRPIVVLAGTLGRVMKGGDDASLQKLASVGLLEVENVPNVSASDEVSEARYQIASINAKRLGRGMNRASLCWNIGSQYAASGREKVFGETRWLSHMGFRTNSVRLEVGRPPYLYAKYEGVRLEVCEILSRALNANPDLDVIFEVCGLQTFSARLGMTRDWAKYLAVIIGEAEDDRRKWGRPPSAVT